MMQESRSEIRERIRGLISRVSNGDTQAIKDIAGEITDNSTRIDREQIKDAVKELKNVMKDESSPDDVREEAAKALGKILGDENVCRKITPKKDLVEEIVESLLELLNNSNIHLQKAAVKALGTITKANYSWYDIKKIEEVIAKLKERARKDNEARGREEREGAEGEHDDSGAQEEMDDLCEEFKKFPNDVHISFEIFYYKGESKKETHDDYDIKWGEPYKLGEAGEITFIKADDHIWIKWDNLGTEDVQQVNFTIEWTLNNKSISSSKIICKKEGHKNFILPTPYLIEPADRSEELPYPNDVHISTFFLPPGSKTGKSGKRTSIESSNLFDGTEHSLEDRHGNKIGSIKFTKNEENGKIEVELKPEKNAVAKLELTSLQWTMNRHYFSARPIEESPMKWPTPEPGKKQFDNPFNFFEKLSARRITSSQRDDYHGSRFTYAMCLNSGYQSWALGDFEKSSEYWENVDNIPGVDASTTDIGGSYFGGIHAFFGYNLPNAHTVGLTAGYEHFFGGPFEHTANDGILIMDTKLDISAHAFPVGLFYRMPVRKNLFVKLEGGVDFFSSTIDYDFTMEDEGVVTFDRGEFKDKGTGYHLSLGAEYRIHKNIALTFDAGYGFADWNDFRGSLVDQDGVKNDMLLIMEEDEDGILGETIAHGLAGEPLGPGARPVEIDFSGLRFYVGLNFYITGENGSSAK